MSTLRKIAALAVVSAGAYAAQADTSIVPASRMTALGGGTEAILLGDATGAGRTLQWVVAESELAGVPRGSKITGLRFRLGPITGLTAWPLSNAAYSSFSIDVSSSLKRIGQLDNAFANNLAPDAVNVRSGPLTLPASSFPISLTLSGFGPRIAFSRPFIYDGGNLLFTVRHSGTLALGIPLIDVIPSGGTGYGTLVQAKGATSASATTASFTAAGVPVAELSFVPPAASNGVTMPADLAVDDGPSAQSTPLGPVASTYQFVISARDLTAVPRGGRLTGISFRLDNNQNAWPPSEVRFTNYQVQVSQAAADPSKMVSGFANNNKAGETVTVRTGPLRIPASGLPGPRADSIATGFGATIQFPTPYVYPGGDLTITIRHSGGLLENGSAAPAPVLDALGTGNLGYGSYIAARSAADANATLGTLVPAAVTRLVFTPAAVCDDRYVNASSNAGASFVFAPEAYTHQVLYAGANLNIPIGTPIEGLSFRLMATFPNAWPLTDAYFNDYSITLSGSTRAIGQLSTNFATNIGANAQVVRSGALRVPANALAAGAAVGQDNPFGYEIRFHEPYIYRGGNLLLTVRQSGNSTLTTPLLESVSLLNNNYNRDIQAMLGAGLNATTGAQSFATLVQFVLKPSVVCPQGAEAAAPVGAGAMAAPLDVQPTTYQFVIDERQLAGVSIGGTIDSLAFRQRTGQLTAWPPAEINFPNYEVRIGRLPTGRTSLGGNFASNVVGETVVRSGSFKLSAGGLPPMGSTAPVAQFGELIGFSRPYVYLGGSLVVTIRHNGGRIEQSVGVPSLPAPTLESVPVNTGVYGTAGSAIAAAGANADVAATGSAASLAVVSFTTTGSPCRADFNRDGVVNDLDFVLFSQAYDRFTDSSGDLNGDGYTDDSDFIFFAHAYDNFGC